MTTAVADPPKPSTATIPAAPAPAAPAAPANPAPAAAEPAKPAEPAPRQTLLSDITDAAKPADAKPADAKPAEGDKPAEKPADPAAPAAEDYSTLKAPEKSDIDVKAIAEFAKAQQITAKQAQALVEREAKLVADFKAKEVAHVQAEHDKLYESWSGAVKADKEFGGDKLAATQAAAKQALTKYGDPELREFLAKSPFGNHPLLMRLLARVGKAMGEDANTAHSTPHGEKILDPVAAFYPKMANKRK